MMELDKMLTKYVALTIMTFIISVCAYGIVNLHLKEQTAKIAMEKGYEQVVEKLFVREYIIWKKKEQR